MTQTEPKDRPSSPGVDVPTYRDLQAATLAPLAADERVTAGYGTTSPVESTQAVRVPPRAADEPFDYWTSEGEDAGTRYVHTELQEAPQDVQEAPSAPEHPSPAPELAPAPTAPLSHLADVLHVIACGCDYGGDVEGHGVDFEVLAAQVRVAVLEEAGVTEKAPVEAKVWAGTWGALGATTALALVTLLLDRLNVIGDLFGGDYPWVSGVVLVLGVVLPPVAQFIRGYLAEHTPRPASVAATGSVAQGAGDSTPDPAQAI